MQEPPTMPPPSTTPKAQRPTRHLTLLLLLLFIPTLFLSIATLVGAINTIALFKSAPTPNHWLLPHWRKNFNFFQLQAVAWTSVLTAVLDLAAVLLVIDVTLVCNTATFLVFFLAQMCR